MHSDGQTTGLTAESVSPEHAVEGCSISNIDDYSMRATQTLLSQTNRMNLELQQASYDIYDQKYALKTQSMEPIDGDLQGTYRRVARALASVEKPEEQERWYTKFLLALNFATPAGRITSNAGAEAVKPGTSLINCTVSGTIPDSMSGILDRVHEAGMTLKAGCGIGYEFSTLRPAGAMVTGVGAQTSGPLSFMDIYDRMCFTVSSAGGRRGAQMGTFDVNHPDVEAFIKAKRADGTLRQFNLSLLITKPFIEAVENDADWQLNFPLSIKEAIELGDKVIETVDRHMPWIAPEDRERYVVNEDGSIRCRVYGTVKARALWNDAIMTSTYNFAEPGFILIDQVNEDNNNWWCETIRATNPCGEQPLPPYGSCLLGSINLAKFVRNPFTDSASFDWEAYREVIRVFTRMLDNVVEFHGLPLSKQAHEITYKRRHGMGFLGLGSACTMLGMKYGSEESVLFTAQVSKALAIVGFRTGVDLAKEKGPAPIMDDLFTVDKEMIAKNPKIAEHFELGEQVPGRVLLTYSGYMRKIAESEHYDLINEIRTHGCRFTHHSSIAPTGTISLSINNNASNGIEPTFAHFYYRNVIIPGEAAKRKIPVYSYELLAYRNFKAAQGTELPEDMSDTSFLPEVFRATSDDLTPEQHVDIQAAAQYWTDSSISKTINCPSDIPFEQFGNVYLYAAKKGLKGCTTFRFNPEAFQGVLVKQSDLENTTYTFTLEDGSTMTFRGDEDVEYEGKTYSAANLADAVKEGYYGKF